MAIPEEQLRAWTTQGSTVGSAETHKSIRNALANHSWPAGMNYEAYLQGSYPNATNIRGDSDVDLVVETDSIFYHDLPPSDFNALGFTPGRFSWSAFRGEVLNALTNYYGAGQIDGSGSKAIKVLAGGGRLPADVVPCAEYRRYSERRPIATGMTFWTTPQGIQVVNYPKIHISNGAAKNQRVSGLYKPAVRMFKNARNAFDSKGVGLSKRFPSYFVECLLYNVPDSCYQGRWSDLYVAAVSHLCQVRDQRGLSRLTTQSEQQWLFGNTIYQWNEQDAAEFIGCLARLWNGWR